MTAFLGGFEITAVRRVGLAAVRVDVATDYTNRLFQLYAGRKLIGVSSTAGVTFVVGQLQLAHCPHALTVVMVTDADRLTDFGSQLPPRPFNQFQISWQADSFPADAKWFELAAATAVDGEVDPDNIIARVAYLGDGDYQFTLPPVDEPGAWQYRITPRDDAFPAGNAGTPVTIEKEIYPYPPDVAVDAAGTRLTASVDDGVLTVSFEYDW